MKAILFIPFARKFAFRLYLHRMRNFAAHHCRAVVFLKSNFSAQQEPYIHGQRYVLEF